MWSKSVPGYPSVLFLEIKARPQIIPVSRTFSDSLFAIAIVENERLPLNINLGPVAL